MRISGWGEELDKNDGYTLSALTKHIYVKKPQELTERIWTNIKPTLIAIMAELRDKRLKKERAVIIRHRQKIVVGRLKGYSIERPVNEIIPGPVDICNMEDFKAVINDTPVDVEVNNQSFEQAVSRLPLLIDEWRATKDTMLVCIMNKTISPESEAYVSTPDVNRKQLELATTIFKCKICINPITYPRILVHNCTHDNHTFWRDSDDLQYALWRNLNDEPWHIERVGFEKRAHLAARQVMECCQQDPDTVTAGEMDELDLWFECTRCFNDSGRLVMGWKTAVPVLLDIHELG